MEQEGEDRGVTDVMMTEADSSKADEVKLQSSSSEPVKSLDEPLPDWFEPLEDDDDEEDDEDAQSWEMNGSRDAEMESLAGESEKSGSVAGSERKHRGRGGGAAAGRKRRTRFVTDSEWEDWPILGEGWKRKVVLRRSGLSVGQSDTYYLSPKGDRVRSKIELLKSISTMDLTNFDFKLGRFVDGDPPKRGRRRKVDRYSPGDCGFSSESSFYNEAADAGDRTYSPGPLFSLGHHARQRQSPSLGHRDVGASIPCTGTSQKDPSLLHLSPLTSPTRQNGPSNGGLLSLTPNVSVSSGDNDTKPSTTIPRFCTRCRNTFTGVTGQTTCQKCRDSCKAFKDNRNIVFRKWLPCGFCRACQLTEDCGKCASCRNGRLNPESRKPVRCRKRKCLCPSPKKRQQKVSTVAQKQAKYLLDRYKTTRTPPKKSLPQYSDSDEQSPLDDGDDEDGYNDETVLRISRRACGKCHGCLWKEDCGTCDFCIDKPKFGGSNKKRQKCRQRQCQREAMGWVPPGRPRPRYKYDPRKSSQNSREKWDFEFSDNEGEKERRTKSSAFGERHPERSKAVSSDHSGQMKLRLDFSRSDSFIENGLQAKDSSVRSLPATETDVQVDRAVSAKLLHSKGPQHPGEGLREEDRTLQRPEVLTRHTQQREQQQQQQQEEVEEGPTILQIFSLGDSNADRIGMDLEPELLQMLTSLRAAVLPLLWCPVLGEGPCLHMLQCSKLSAMADTAVQIEPSFSYHISVQGQPLLPTHWVYDAHPARLTCVAEVTALLEDLERYAVCQGLDKEPLSETEPVVRERAATCEFLITPEAKRCSWCKSAQQRSSSVN